MNEMLSVAEPSTTEVSKPTESIFIREAVASQQVSDKVHELCAGHEIAEQYIPRIDFMRRKAFGFLKIR